MGYEIVIGGLETKELADELAKFLTAGIPDTITVTVRESEPAYEMDDYGSEQTNG